MDPLEDRRTMAKNRKKLLIAAAVVAGLLVLAVVVLLTTEFDSPELGRLALGKVGEASGFDLQAKGFRLNLLRGLELEEVEARAIDGSLQASVDKLVFKHRPSDLLGGTLTVTEVLIQRPVVELEARGEAPAEPKPAGEPAPDAAEPAPEGEATGSAGEETTTSLDLAISSVRLVDGSVVQRTTTGGTTATTEVRGLEVELGDLTLGAGSGEQAAGRGEIRIAEIELDDGEATTTVRDLEIDLESLTIDRSLALADTALSGMMRVAEVHSATGEVSEELARELSGRLELEAGNLRLQELELTAPQGAFKGELAADVAAETLTYSMHLRGDALSTGVLLGLGDLKGLGTSVFELEASGEGSELAQTVGKGSLKINGGQLPDHPALAQVEQLLGNVALIGVGYQAFPVEFDIRSHRIHLAPCKLTAGPVSLTLGGWVDFDGPLEMELTALVPPEGLEIKEIPAEVLAVLSEEDGRVNLPMLLTGTADGSKVALNQAYLKQLGKRYVRKRAEKEIGKALGRLFSRDN